MSEQNQPIARWQQSLSNFVKALATLQEVVELSKTKQLDGFERDSLIKRFEYSYEEGAKAVRRYLEHEGHQDLKGTRTTLRRAVKEGIVVDGQAWMDMVDDYNYSVQNYDEIKAKKITEQIIKQYHPMLVSLNQSLQRLF